MLLMRRVGNRNWSDLELPGMMVLPVFSMGNWWNQSEYLYITSILPSKYTQNQRGSIQFEPPKPQRGTKICTVKLVFWGPRFKLQFISNSLQLLCHCHNLCQAELLWGGICGQAQSSPIIKKCRWGFRNPTGRCRREGFWAIFNKTIQSFES